MVNRPSERVSAPSGVPITETLTPSTGPASVRVIPWMDPVPLWARAGRGPIMSSATTAATTACFGVVIPGRSLEDGRAECSVVQSEVNHGDLINIVNIPDKLFLEPHLVHLPLI